MKNNQPGLHLGIDATNVRQGGGITHLSQLLQVCNPAEVGVDRVSIWASKPTLAILPDQPWLQKCSSSWIERALPLRMIGQQLLLPRELKSNACDVLFSPGGTLLRWSPVPTVSMSQNMLPFEPSEARRFGFFSFMRLKMDILRYTQGRSFKSADGVIFLTKYAEHAISKSLKGVSGVTDLIPHGVEPRFLKKPRSPREFESCSVEKPFKVLYVSILMPYKHQVEVAIAASQLHAEGIPIEMRFVGDSWGKYGQQFRSLLDKLDPKREFLLWSGAKTFESIHCYYQDTDLFVFASSCENLPNILIEAMAAGLPIACSDRGPMPEVLGEAGIYFNPEQPTSIAEVLRKLIYDAPLRAKLADLAMNKAKGYSWERCARDTFTFIAKVANRNV